MIALFHEHVVLLSTAILVRLVMIKPSNKC